MHWPSEGHSTRSFAEEEWVRLNCTDDKFETFFRQELDQFDDLSENGKSFLKSFRQEKELQSAKAADFEAELYKQLENAKGWLKIAERWEKQTADVLQKANQLDKVIKKQRLIIDQLKIVEGSVSENQALRKLISEQADLIDYLAWRN